MRAILVENISLRLSVEQIKNSKNQDYNIALFLIILMK